MALIDYALEKSVQLLNQELVNLDAVTKEYRDNPTAQNESWLHAQIMVVNSYRQQVSQLQRVVQHRIAEHGK